MTILLITFIMGYWVTLHHHKQKINDWIDYRLSHIVGNCRFCRGFWFGVAQGMLIAMLIYQFL